MSSINKKSPKPMSHNSAGTPVNTISAERQLVRLTLANMLWEDQYYVSGKTNTQILAELVKSVDAKFVSRVAELARTKFKMRHVPLFLCRELARTGRLTADALTSVIKRADEMGEFLALYNKDKKQPLSNQVKKGLAKALKSFNEFQLAKWDKNSAAYSVRDVMLLCHPKPDNAAQAELFKKVADQNLATPDTWETELSSGAEKAETFSRLMDEKKLGALAFLRNLRNMLGSGISESKIRAYSKTLDVSKVLPFRYLAAANIVPSLEDMLEEMMFRSLASHEKLKGRTVLVIDTSGSMSQRVSSKSDLSAIDAAVALAMLAREICEEVVIYATAGSDLRRTHATAKLSPRRGFGLREQFKGPEVRALGSGGIFFVQAMQYIAEQEKNNIVDRVIVFTDEQDTSGGAYGRNFNPALAKRIGKNNYILNVGSNQNGVNSAEWETVTGFSEASIDYIQALEAVDSGQLQF